MEIRADSASSTARISSPQPQRVWAEGKVLSDFTTDSRSEQAWRESLIVASSSLRHDCNSNTAQQSHDTAAASRKLRMAARLQSLPCGWKSIWDMRSSHEPLALYCSLFLKWQSLSRNSVAEHGIQSALRGQVTDEDVIGKALSNEPVKQSHRAIITGLLMGLTPLTLGSTLQQPLLWFDLFGYSLIQV